MELTLDELLTLEHLLIDVQDNITDYVDDMDMYVTQDNFMLMLTPQEIVNIKSILAKLQ